MGGKRKTLPKDFEELISAGDVEALKTVFDNTELDAYGGYHKQAALAYAGIPTEFIRWLVNQGANIEAADTKGATPLHAQASKRDGEGAVLTLLELGADIDARDEDGETPLHYSARNWNPAVAGILLDHGADVDARSTKGRTPLHVAALDHKSKMVSELVNRGADTQALDDDNRTPLDLALVTAANKDIVDLVPISEILRSPDGKVSPAQKEAVGKLGRGFEFFRESFNRDSVDATDEALHELYRIFGVEAAPRRQPFDMSASIELHGDTWQKQFENLWDVLVPARGSAQSVQGELIRIAGRVDDELVRNGGANWNQDYRKMLDSYLAFVASRAPLDADDRQQAESVVAEIRPDGQLTDSVGVLARLAVKWVGQNSTPVPLPKPNYSL